MSTTTTRNPFMGSVTVTTTAQDILTLFGPVRTKLGNHASYVQVQSDVSAGGSVLYIGDADVSPTNCGVALYGAGASQIFAFDSNLLVLGDIFLRASTGTVQANLMVVVR